METDDARGSGCELIEIVRVIKVKAADTTSAAFTFYRFALNGKQHSSIGVASAKNRNNNVIAFFKLVFVL